MARWNRLEQPKEARGPPVPAPVQDPSAPESIVPVLPIAGGDPNEGIPLTSRKIGDAFPVEIAIVQGANVQLHPDVETTLTQIDPVADDVRVLTATPPGTGDLTIVGHTINFGYVEAGDISPIALVEDSVILNQATPNTNNFQSTANSRVFQRTTDGAITSIDETIFRFDRPRNNIAAINIYILEINTIQDTDGAATGNTVNNANDLKLNLLLADLSPGGAFDVQVIDFNDAQYTGTGTSSLYSNSANFDDNAGSGFVVRRLTTQGSGTITHPFSLIYTGSNAKAPAFRSGYTIGMNFVSSKTAGPYTGFHLYWDTSPSVTPALGATGTDRLDYQLDGQNKSAVQKSYAVELRGLS